MTIVEIIALARQMVSTLRNGFMRAVHYLKSLNFSPQSTCLALRGLKK